MSDDDADDIIAELKRHQARRTRIVAVVAAVILVGSGAVFTIAGIIAIRTPNNGGMAGRVLGAGIGFILAAGFVVANAFRRRR